MDFLNDINEKYRELEAEADKILEKATREEEKLQKLEYKAMGSSTSIQQSPKQLSYAEARTRNANLLKALDMAKARLRSRSTFSPVEQILNKAIENYKKDLMKTSPATQEKQTQSTNFRDEIGNIYETLE